MVRAELSCGRGVVAETKIFSLTELFALDNAGLIRTRRENKKGTFFISNLADQREVQKSSAVLYITYINRLRIFRIVTFPTFGSSLSARLPPHLFQHFIDDAPIDKLFEIRQRLPLWPAQFRRSPRFKKVFN